MASNSKDVLKALIEEQDTARVLDKKWRTHKPEKSDFSLEGVNIEKLCIGREAHYANCEKKAEQIRREIPSEKSWSSISLGWEGAVMVALCILIYIYYRFVGTPGKVASIVVTIISFGTVGLWFVRALRTKANRKKEIKDLENMRKQILREVFADEETYERVCEYAKAFADYETWQNLQNPSFLRELPASKLREILFSLYLTIGCDAEGTYDEYIDFISIIDDTETAISCLGGKKLTMQHLDGFVDEIKEHDLSSGIIYSFGNIDGNIAAIFTSDSINYEGVSLELQGVNEIRSLLDKIN